MPKKIFLLSNTPGTAGGPGGRDRTLALKSRKTIKKSFFFFRKKIKISPKKYFFLHISSSYAKILGEKLFRTWEIPQSGSKAKDGERKKERKRKVGDNNGQATHACMHAWRTQAAWANYIQQNLEDI